MICSAVLGLGFGDEGKGSVVSYLTKAGDKDDTIVVRFSGGHQVGHTVCTNGIKHVFSNFGSGTLDGIPTYWSKFCTVELYGMAYELKLLLDKGIAPKLFIDCRCQITTYFDINYNINDEQNMLHGSCGVGFGATIERVERGFSLTILDFLHKDIFALKVKNLFSNYYGKTNLDECYAYLEGVEELREKISEYVVYNTDNASTTTYLNPSNILDNYRHIIFEGSQGLLLDKRIGFFPNVTRAYTDLTNVGSILSEINSKHRWFRLYLVTRAYQTRHGNGPMTNEDIPHNIKINPTETNVDNYFQGTFRRTLLDLSLLKYSIESLKHYSWNTKVLPTLRTDSTNIVMTCLDHIENEYRLTENKKVLGFSNEEEFINKIMFPIPEGVNILLSRSEVSDNITNY